MRVPFHAVRLDVDVARAVSDVATLAAEPAVRMDVLRDAVDVPYAYDLVLTDGFAATLAAYVALRVLRAWWWRRRRRRDE